MSYLRGPLTRPQVRRLMAERKKALARTSPALAVESPAVTPAYSALRETGDLSDTKPALDPSVTQVFLPVEIDEREAIRKMTGIDGSDVDVENIWLVYEPRILGSATVRFYSSKLKVDEQVEKILLAPVPETVGGMVWNDAEILPIYLDRLLDRPEQIDPNREHLFAPAPQHVNSAREIRRINKDLADWLYYNERLNLEIHKDLDVFQHPGESQGGFLIRLKQAARERRDAEVDKLEEKYARQLDRLEKKMRKLEFDLSEDEAEYQARKREEMVGVGETVLSFFMGRRRTSAATTIARRRRMTSKVKMEIEETKAEIAEIEEDIEKVGAELKKAIDEIVDKWEEAQDDVTTKEVKPRRTDVRVQLVALAWMPVWLIRYLDGKFQKTSKISAYPTSKDI